MKKFWGSWIRPIRNRNYQMEAIKHAEDMEQSQTVQRAPRYLSEQKHFMKMQENEEIAEDIRKRHDVLVDNMNKITITSSEPEPRWTSAKTLPPGETEWVHRNDKIWEFGFYEPPPEKIPKGKLTFREAFEIMQVRCDEEFALKLDEERRKILLPQILDSLGKHPAVQRIGKNALDAVWQYFRPFERKEEQQIVSKRHIDELRNIMLGFESEQKIPTISEMWEKKKRLEQAHKSYLTSSDSISEEEKERLEKLEKMKELKIKEEMRLEQEMEKFGLVEKDAEKKETDTVRLLSERAK